MLSTKASTLAQSTKVAFFEGRADKTGSLLRSLSSAAKLLVSSMSHLSMTCHPLDLAGHQGVHRRDLPRLQTVDRL